MCIYIYIYVYIYIYIYFQHTEPLNTCRRRWHGISQLGDGCRCSDRDASASRVVAPAVAAATAESDADAVAAAPARGPPPGSRLALKMPDLRCVTASRTKTDGSWYRTQQLRRQPPLVVLQVGTRRRGQDPMDVLQGIGEHDQQRRSSYRQGWLSKCGRSAWH